MSVGSSIGSSKCQKPKVIGERTLEVVMGKSSVHLALDHNDETAKKVFTGGYCGALALGIRRHLGQGKLVILFQFVYEDLVDEGVAEMAAIKGPISTVNPDALRTMFGWMTLSTAPLYRAVHALVLFDDYLVDVFGRRHVECYALSTSLGTARVVESPWFRLIEILPESLEIVLQEGIFCEMCPEHVDAFVETLAKDIGAQAVDCIEDRCVERSGSKRMARTKGTVPFAP